MTTRQRPLAWIGSSYKDLTAMPDMIKDEFGHALFLAQIGLRHANVKPLQGFGSAGVLEVVESDAGGTYRAVSVRDSGLRPALLPKEVDARDRNAKARHRPDP